MVHKLAILLVSALALALGGCPRAPVAHDESPAAQSGGAAPSVLLLAAASTSNALDEIASEFTAETGIGVRMSTGPSNALANQIIAGAPADVFISANTKWAAAVAEKKLAAEVRPLLTNDLVIVVPRGNPAQVQQPADLLTPGVKKIALAGEDVPAGIYAQQALTSLNLYQQLVDEKKIVRGHDVRVALTYVERGEVEAGIVYSTDALVTDKVETAFTFSPSNHDPIEYPAVLLSAGRENPSAVKFFAYLQSAAAQKIFARHGFEVIVLPQ